MTGSGGGCTGGHVPEAMMLVQSLWMRHKTKQWNNGSLQLSNIEDSLALWQIIKSRGFNLQIT